MDMKKMKMMHEKMEAGVNPLKEKIKQSVKGKLKMKIKEKLMKGKKC